jgi:hypothetical protein
MTDAGAVYIGAHPGAIRLELHGVPGQSLHWSVRFGATEPLQKKAPLKVSPGTASANAITFTLATDPPFPIAGFYLFRNGGFVGFFSDNEFLDESVEPMSDYTYQLVPVDFGSGIGSNQTMTLRPAWPQTVVLTKLPVRSWEPQWLPPRVNQGFDGKPLTYLARDAAGYAISGSVAFRLSRAYAQLEGGVVALEDCSIRILADGKLIWESGRMARGESKSLKVSLSEAYEMRIETDGAGAVVNPVITAKQRP